MGFNQGGGKGGYGGGAGGYGDGRPREFHKATCSESEGGRRERYTFTPPLLHPWVPNPLFTHLR